VQQGFCFIVYDRWFPIIIEFLWHSVFLITLKVIKNNFFIFRLVFSKTCNMLEYLNKYSFIIDEKGQNYMSETWERLKMLHSAVNYITTSNAIWTTNNIAQNMRIPSWITTNRYIRTCSREMLNVTTTISICTAKAVQKMSSRIFAKLSNGNKFCETYISTIFDHFFFKSVVHILHNTILLLTVKLASVHGWRQWFSDYRKDYSRRCDPYVIKSQDEICEHLRDSFDLSMSRERNNLKKIVFLTQSQQKGCRHAQYK